MRSVLLLIFGAAILASLTTSGCRKKPSREEALRSLQQGVSDLERLLRTGPATWVVAGPKTAGAPFLEDGSRWAAEEMASLLRDEGYDDLVGSKDEEAAVGPVREVQVVAPGPSDELLDRARKEGAQVLVFIGLRSIELIESSPRRLEWSYDGSVELLETGGEGSVAWEVTGSTQSEMPHEVPDDPQEARRPLAAMWAQKALRIGALGLGTLGAVGDGSPSEQPRGRQSE